MHGILRAFQCFWLRCMHVPLSHQPVFTVALANLHWFLHVHNMYTAQCVHRLACTTFCRWCVSVCSSTQVMSSRCCVCVWLHRRLDECTQKRAVFILRQMSAVFSHSFFLVFPSVSCRTMSVIAVQSMTQFWCSMSTPIDHLNENISQNAAFFMSKKNNKCTSLLICHQPDLKIISLISYWFSRSVTRLACAIAHQNAHHLLADPSESVPKACTQNAFCTFPQTVE